MALLYQTQRERFDPALSRSAELSKGVQMFWQNVFQMFGGMFGMFGTLMECFHRAWECLESGAAVERGLTQHSAAQPS